MQKRRLLLAAGATRAERALANDCTSSGGTVCGDCSVSAPSLWLVLAPIARRAFPGDDLPDVSAAGINFNDALAATVISPSTNRSSRIGKRLRWARPGAVSARAVTPLLATRARAHLTALPTTALKELRACAGARSQSCVCATEGSRLRGWQEPPGGLGRLLAGVLEHAQDDLDAMLVDAARIAAGSSAT
jgi:hypothetical protein